MNLSTTMKGSSRRSGLAALLLLVVMSMMATTASGDLIELSEDDWESVLKGEWMVKFYAPWCPACRSIEKVWAEFASWDQDLGLDGVAEVDVTHSPGLSGRFLITSLPTIFHVKDGEFRVYSGGRSKDNLIDYIEKSKWKSEEVLPSWKNPSALHMSVVSWFFKISMHLRNVHSYLTEEKALPSWSVYTLFAVTTVVTGALLGLVLVVCIDCVLPFVLSRAGKREDTIPPSRSNKAKDSDDEDDDDDDGDIKEEESDEDAKEEEEVKEKTSSVRSRKPRKD